MSVPFNLLSTTIRAALVLIGIASVFVLALATNRDNQPPFNPFAPYADILSAQSPDTFLQRGFNCPFKRTSTFDDTICFLALDNGVFLRIHARFPYNSDQVSTLIFIPRDNAVLLGQLVLLWGKPELLGSSQYANFQWPSRHIIAVPQSDNSQFSYWLPISSVAFGAVG